ncbi:MAG: tape measure protein [Hyphomicrobium sp.]
MTTEVEKLVVTLEAQLGKYNADMTRAQAITNQKLSAMEGRFSTFARTTTSSIGGIGAAMGTLGTYLTVGQLRGYADGWTRVSRSLDGTEQSFGVTLTNAERLTDLANDSRVDLDSYAKLYTRTSAAIRDYGMEAGTAEVVTSTLAKALKLGGASASEQASVITQFSQALQKGKLDGDEFRTVMENAGVVQELLAKRLGVTKGRIIELAAAGKIQIRDLVGAMTDGKDVIDRIFKGLPQTMDEAFVVLNNSVTRYVGNLDKTFGITKSVTSATAFLARNIETLGDVALVTAAAILSIAGPRVLMALGGLGVASLAAAGPLGLLLGVVGGSAAAFQLFQDDVKVTADGVVSLRDKIEGLREAIDNANAVRLNVAPPAMPSTMNGFGVEGDAMTGDIQADADRIARQIAMGRGFASSTQTIRPPSAATATDTAEKGKRNAYERETASILKRVEAMTAEARVVGESAAVQERAKQMQALLTAAREADIKLTPPHLAAIDELSTRYGKAAGELAYLNALRSTKEGNEDLARELDLIGKTGFELHRARVEQELLNAARKAGGPITEQRRAEIDALARERAIREQTLETMREIDAISKDALKGFITDLREGKSAAEALGGTLNKIADKLIDMAVNDLVGAALGGLGGKSGAGGIGGLLSGIFGGGVAGAGGWIFGEAGPEAAVPLPDGRRIPVDLRMPQMPASAPAAGPSSVTIAPVFNVQNGTPEGIDKLKTEIVPLMRQVARSEVATLFDRSAKFKKIGG